jgi:hypothetical protein
MPATAHNELADATAVLRTVMEESARHRAQTFDQGAKPLPRFEVVGRQHFPERIYFYRTKTNLSMFEVFQVCGALAARSAH